MGPSVESFHYSRMSAEWGVLRLLANVGSHLPPPSAAQLMVEPGPGSRDVFYAPARMSSLERRLLTHTREHGSQLLWRSVFALPLEVIEFPDALFRLVGLDDFSLQLPAPGLQLTVDQLAARPRLALSTPPLRRPANIRIRQRAVALATAVAVTAGSTPAAALAAGAAGGSLSITAPSGMRAPSSAPAASITTTAATRAVPHPFTVTRLFSTPAHPAGANLSKARIAASCATRTVKGPVAYAAAKVPGRTARSLKLRCPVPAHHGDTAKHSTATDTGRSPKGATLTLSVAPKSTSGTPSTGTPTGGPTATHSHKTHTKAPQHRPARSHPSGGVAVAPVLPQPAPAPGPTQPVTGLSPTAPGLSVPGAWTGTVAADPALTGAVTNLSGLLSNGNRPPSFLIPIYMEAGHKFGVPWEVLAAINAIETDYGQNLNTSSAGAVGWMQFEPSTWAQYGMSVDGHSMPNPYDPRDAIFSAAKYLAAAGAREDVAKAVFSYNHAGWYVDEVMARAHAIASHAQYQHMIVKHGTFSVDFATGVKKTPVVRYSSGVLSHFDRLIAAANMVSAANFPYLYGGGHEQPAQFAPFDCSGSVSYVMQQAGYTVPTTVSGQIPVWKFPAGPGRVTIFYNSWHTFMRIGNRYFGTSGFARPGGGAGWFDVDKLPSDYLAKFNVVHVPNLGVNSFAPGENYTPINLPTKRFSSTLDIPASMQLSTLGAFPSAQS
jgi:transglycosylase-like protein with SLT domain